jgi:hypothetical protein
MPHIADTFGPRVTSFESARNPPILADVPGHHDTAEASIPHHMNMQYRRKKQRSKIGRQDCRLPMHDATES